MRWKLAAVTGIFEVGHVYWANRHSRSSWSSGTELDGEGASMTANGGRHAGLEERGGENGGPLSRLNILIARTAAIVGLIYGYDLGSIASAILFLVPDLRPLYLHDLRGDHRGGARAASGALFAGRITNTIGRKRTMVLVALGYAVFAGLQGLAPNEWFLTVVRFLLGFRYRRLHSDGAGLHRGVGPEERPGFDARHLPDSHHLGHRHRLLRRRGARRHRELAAHPLPLGHPRADRAVPRPPPAGHGPLAHDERPARGGA